MSKDSTYTLSRADFLAFRKQAQLQLRKRRPWGPWLFLVQITVWLFIGAAVSSFLRVYERAGALQSGLLLVASLIVSAVVVFFLAQAIIARIVEKHLLLDAGGFLSPQTLTCEGGGIRVTTQSIGSSAWLPWAAFMGRAEDSRNLYLFTEPSYGIIIPKAALSHESNELLRARIREL
jgi:hypothetical protein